MSEKATVLAWLGAWSVALVSAVVISFTLTVIELAVGYQTSSMLFRIVLTGLAGTWVMSKVLP